LERASTGDLYLMRAILDDYHAISTSGPEIHLPAAIQSGTDETELNSPGADYEPEV
jgi:hypothetical protein